MTDGILYKEPEKMGKLKSNYYERFVVLDFKRHLMRFRKKINNYHSNDGFGENKETPFHEIIDYQLVALDVYRAEHKTHKSLPYKSKFAVRTLNREFIFFAKNDKEREVWCSSLAKILEYNRDGGNGNFNLKLGPDMTMLKNESIAFNAIAKGTRDARIDVQIDGVQVYKS